jgi:hypothetical protein
MGLAGEDIYGVWWFVSLSKPLFAYPSVELAGRALLARTNLASMDDLA